MILKTSIFLWKWAFLQKLLSKFFTEHESKTQSWFNVSHQEQNLNWEWPQTCSFNLAICFRNNNVSKLWRNHNFLEFWFIPLGPPFISRKSLNKKKREVLFTHIPTLLKHISSEKETSQFPISHFVNENFIIAT